MKDGANTAHEDLDKEASKFNRAVINILILECFIAFSSSLILFNGIPNHSQLEYTIFILPLTVINIIVGFFWLSTFRNKDLGTFLLFLMLALDVYILLIDFAYIYKFYGLIDSSTHEIIHSGFTSLYFSVMTWTTVGFGDFYPSVGAARFYASIEALSGYLGMAALITAFISLFKTPNWIKRMKEANLTLVRIHSILEARLSEAGNHKTELEMELKKLKKQSDEIGSIE